MRCSAEPPWLSQKESSQHRIRRERERAESHSGRAEGASPASAKDGAAAGPSSLPSLRGPKPSPPSVSGNARSRLRGPWPRPAGSTEALRTFPCGRASAEGQEVNS